MMTVSVIAHASLRVPKGLLFFSSSSRRWVRHLCSGCLRTGLMKTADM